MIIMIMMIIVIAVNLRGAEADGGLARPRR